MTEIPTETPAFTPTPGPTPRGGGGGQIAFVSERTGRAQIFLIGVDGSGETQLTTLPDGACQPAWSPDGQSLLFISPCKEKEVFYPGASIYIRNMADGSVSRHIDALGGAFSPDWSGSGIAFTHLELNQPRVWVARSDGGNSRQISEPNALDSHPSWSPDGARIVLVNNSRTDRPTLFWIFKDGSLPGSRPDPVTRSESSERPGLVAQRRLDRLHRRTAGVGRGLGRQGLRGPAADSGGTQRRSGFLAGRRLDRNRIVAPGGESRDLHHDQRRLATNSPDD